MATDFPLEFHVSSPSNNNPAKNFTDLTIYERSRSQPEHEKSSKRKYNELLDTILEHEAEKESWENQERDNRAKSRAEKRRIINQLKIAEHMNNKLENDIAALRSRHEALQRALAESENDYSAMKSSYRQRLQRITAENMELEKSLKTSLGETDNVRRSLEDYSRKYKCSICMHKEVDRITKCGHLFCKECLAEWEKKWLQEHDPNGVMQGIVKCPVCREWVIISDVKGIYYS